VASLSPSVIVLQAFRRQLWFVSYPQGVARRLTNDLLDYQACCLDLTRDGQTLVDTEQTRVSNLWIASGGDARRAKQITTNDIMVNSFSWMPDGDIVFAAGDGNILSVKPDGNGRTLLTPNQQLNSSPSVCGDGQYVVFISYREQKQGFGAWIPMGPTRSSSLTRRSRKTRYVPRMASGSFICAARSGS
jgi:hypothetical protein